MTARRAPAAPIAPPRRCRSQAERDALLARARELGVPADYGRVRGLSLQREPATLVLIGPDVYGRAQWLQPPAARALAAMRAAAAQDGVELQVVSAFRSIEYQLGIIQRKVERGEYMRNILRVSAAPGYSEHHSGRCVDLTTPGYVTLDEVFQYSLAFVWLSERAPEFGFTLSYPEDNPHGIAYEPWHWCWHTGTAIRARGARSDQAGRGAV